ncbi:MAG: Two-component nitrogen fixation transcriptional regulator FixJ [Myxococcaceae bacterium]|nr:Two-component nitrogen fixation transcriptional regulator FixJ [Myxococcaceae bacterium]
MFQRGFFLLIAKDDGLALTLSEPLQRYSVVRRAKCYREAVAMLLPNSRWSGVVVDLDGFDADPLETMKRLREAHPLVPVLALASQVSAELVNGLHAWRAELVLKPVGEINLVSFVQRSLVSGWLPDDRVAAWVDELARARGLTPREVQLMAYALGNESRQKVMRRLGITENTLKTQVRSLLRKCNARSMDGLAKTVLRDALIFETQPLDADTGDETDDAPHELEVEVDSNGRMYA